MDKNALKAWLREDPDAWGLLVVIHEESGDDPETYGSMQSAGKALGLGMDDVLEHTENLEARGLLRGSGRVSGGHRPTSVGRQVVKEMQQSRLSGSDRYDHTAREILRRMAEDGGDVIWDEVAAWGLHEDGLPEVTEQERQTCMTVLEDQGYIKGTHAHGQGFVRTTLLDKGRLVLGRPEVSLTGGLFAGSSVTNYDNRVGVQADMFNNQGGQVQTGDYGVQNMINQDMRQQILTKVESVRDLLAYSEYDEKARVEVSEALDVVEAEAKGNGEPGVIQAAAQKALNAAALVGGTTVANHIVQGLGELIRLIGS